MSYTTFEYSDLDITPRVITPNESATVRLKVTNTGKCAGDEVVQLYIRDVLSSITTYEKNLAGFQRIHLEPGEAQELSFTIDRKHLELLDADMKWVVEPGDFVLMAGASSEDIRLNGTLTVASVLFNIFMNALELLVAFIQAYVFTMLSAVFIGLAQEEHKEKAVK